MTRADYELAIPHCHRRLLIRKGQHGVQVTCYRPMKYRARTNTWHCECGKIDTGAEVAGRRWEVAA